jgi:hypothetical protein
MLFADAVRRSKEFQMITIYSGNEQLPEYLFFFYGILRITACSYRIEVNILAPKTIKRVRSLMRPAVTIRL